MNELWKPVQKYNVLRSDGNPMYEVSNFGTVRTTAYTDDNGIRHEPVPCEVRYSKSRDGVVFVVIETSVGKRHLAVHRLVASTFISNPHGYKFVVHRDGDKRNNRADNLEWRISAYKGSSRGKVTDGVRVYTRDFKLLGEFDTIREAAELLNLSKSSVSKCCRGRCSTYLGLIWRNRATDEYYREGMETDIEQLKKLCMLRGSGRFRGSIRQYSFSGMFIKEYPSATVASDETGVGAASIRNSCARDVMSCESAIWRYSEDDELYRLSIDERKLIIMQKFPDSIDKRPGVVDLRNGHNAEHFIRQYARDGRLVGEYLTAREVSDDYNYYKSVAAQCRRASQRGNTFGGFIWRYSDDDEFENLSVQDRAAIFSKFKYKSTGRIIRQYTLDGELIAEHKTIQSAKAAVKDRLPPSGDIGKIVACCERRRKSSCGFIWRYADSDEIADSIK